MKLIKKSFYLCLVILASACTKIDTTTLGGELIPVVDNINTFDTILEVQAQNEFFTDSTRLGTSEAFAIGNINDDPLFGKTNGELFFELKPAIFPSVVSDSLVTGFDSAVLVLSFKGVFGDTIPPLNFKLFELGQNIRNDSVYNLSSGFTAGSTLLGQKTISPKNFKDTNYIKRGDSLYAKTTNELRIRINPSFAQDLFNKGKDSTINGMNYNDSTFKTKFKGFALNTDVGRAICYFGLGTGAKLEFFYRKQNRTKSGIKQEDTVSISYVNTAFTGFANKIIRNRAGATINNFLAPNTSEVFIQGSPGTYATLKIPALAGLSNRVIHRAELIMVQSPDPLSETYAPSPGLYLDAQDTGTVLSYKGIPYDLSPETGGLPNTSGYGNPCYPFQSGINFPYFGGITQQSDRREIINGQKYYTYNFALTRYVQNIVTKKERSYDLRLSAPFNFSYSNCNSSTTIPPIDFIFNGSRLNPVAGGRIRLYGGTGAPDPKLKMRLRIIYSKI